MEISVVKTLEEGIPIRLNDGHCEVGLLGDGWVSGWDLRKFIELGYAEVYEEDGIKYVRKVEKEIQE